ncbi:MAG: electron transport complex subunit RsxD [Gammaproteobacteria bacterium]|nr:electron transport complex subunit RsxD [Gammaproteobacteria bacterium]
MQFETSASPHNNDVNNVARVMRHVIYALIPGTLAYAWFFGPGVLINLALAIALALGFEALVLKLRKQAIKPVLSDGSALVTAWLLVLALPPLTPWWMIAIGIGFAIIVAKQLYGGLGYNPFNPAMVGYVVLIISFPREMTLWPAPQELAQQSFGLWQSAQIIFSGSLPNALSWDAITMATPLDITRTQLGQNMMLSEIQDSPLFGTFGGVGWEWIGNWFFLGGLYLLKVKIIDWRIPFSLIATLLIATTLTYASAPDAQAGPMFHLFSGGVILAAFFIATDPVSAPASNRGRLIYGCGIALFIVIIRQWGGYPDGIAFAVLLMNMVVPTIDHYIKPAVFGQSSKE